MKIKIKTSNEATFEFTLQESTLVKELKQLISDHYKGETSVTDQRLIFAGKVLKDEEPMSTYKLADGNTIHLVRGGGVKKSSASPTPTPTASDIATTAATQPIPGNPLANMFGTASGLPPLGSFTGGPGMGMGMEGLPANAMNDPMFATMMSQMMSNPQMLDMLLASNPQLAAMITPQMRAQMQSPDFQAMVSNPQMMQQMMQMQSMMGGMGGMGAGANPLANMYGQPGNANPYGQPVNPSGANPFQAMMNANAAAATPTQPPEELYATQLQQLKDMGFFSQTENIRALQISHGNVEAAVEILFSRPPGSL